MNILKIIVILSLLAFLPITFTSCNSNSDIISNDPSSNSTQGVQWLYDWEETLHKAQLNNTPIMINFYTQVCPYCVKLDRDTFANRAVASFLNENFICVKIDASKNSIASNYYITGVPMTYFTTIDGTAMGYMAGYIPPETFLTGAQKALDLWLNESKDKDNT